MRASLVVYLGRAATCRAVDVPDGANLVIGRAPSAAIAVDDERISRRHARIRRRRDALEIEDLRSRNGTHVNGARITGVQPLAAGDEIAIGPILAIVNISGGARTADARLAAELDRSARYDRPLTLALLRLAAKAAVDDVARGLRPMDALARLGADEYLAVLPELDRDAGRAAVARLVDCARHGDPGARGAAALCPDDGTHLDGLLAQLRADLRSGRRHAIGVRGQLEQAERGALVAALAASGGNQTQAARVLGVTRRAVIYKMEKFGLKPPPPSPRGRRVRLTK